MKISIVTVVLNAKDTIQDALDSVARQTHDNIEHIVVDGGSSDGTLAILRKADAIKLISEPDEGLYDAMNKGIQMATGDVIGLLNADDFYQHDNVLERVAELHVDPNLDACYADLVYVRPSNLDRVVRYWRSREFEPGLCWKGWMPAHPTLFMKKRVYEKIGLFNTQLRYQADLEFCARAFELHGISSCYVNDLWVRMRTGGVTNNSFLGIIKGNWESFRALQRLGLKTNPFSYFAVKFASRLRQFL